MRKVFLTMLIVFCIIINAQSQSYEEGYYYNKNGEKITGLIQVSPGEDHLLFKTDEKARSQKVKIENIKSVVLASDPADSLTVVAEKDKKYFGKLMATMPTTRFYIRLCVYASAISA